MSVDTSGVASRLIRMDLTSTFAQLWGPVLIMIGAGIFAGSSHYLSVYRDLKREPFAAFVFGIFAVVLGLGHVSLHSHWSTATEIIITLLGWGLLLKGAAFIVAPDLVATSGRAVSSRASVTAIAAALIALGGYLSWVSYFA
jgi:hypothetical protein